MCSRAAITAVVVLAAAAAPAGARVFLTAEEALALAFPGCEVERQTVYLTADQLAEARRLAGVEIPGALVSPYRARCAGDGGDGSDGTGGTAYFDTHRVRTLPETLMVVVDPEGKVRRIEVLVFREPEEYLPRGGWYGQFTGHALDDGLALKRDVRGVAGATLTARATTDAVRRVLAIHRVIAAAAAGGSSSAAPAAAAPSSPSAAGEAPR